MRLKIRLVTLSLVSVFAAFAADARETAQLDRLADLAKLWAAVKYLHPYLAYREDIDWDKALVEAIPKAIAANDGATYAAAVAGMLAALHDPATCVLPHPAQPISADADKNRERDPRFKMTGNGVLVVFVNHYDDLIDYRGAVAKMAEIKKQIAKARAVVFDLRPVVPVNPDSRLVSMSLNFGEIASRLAAVPLTTPGERRRMHIGFAPQTYAESGAYSSALAVSDGIRIEPAEKTQTGPVIFVINGESELPPFALALQAAGRGAIVAEGDGADAAAILTRRMRLAYGVAARIRLGELAYADGTGGFAPDITVPASNATGDENPAWKAAMDLANSFKPAKIQRRALRSGAPLREKSYADMTYPSAEYRLLGLFRFWAAIHYLYPYRDLMGEDWAAVLREFIPRMEKAASGLEYARLLEDMGTHIHDGHVSVISKVLREANGAAVLPLGVRMIEGAPVVIRLDDEAAAKAAGIEIGDILLKIDGEAALARIEEAKKHIASATPQWLGLLAANEILRGPDKSTATLVIRGRNGEEREVTLARASPRAWRGSGGRKGDIVRVLNGNIGYVDLERLTVPMVDEMFDKLKDTKGIVFDMRDYPNGTAWLIAPRLTEKNDVAGAIYQRPVLMTSDGADGDVVEVETLQTFTQKLPRTSGWRYKGRTATLIDERAVSQAEHSCLFFEAANGMKFVGSPTAGTNGDVTYLVLPGGISISFTGQAVRHADGRQLQRIGIQPDVPVAPTLAGIRAGRDEVLEKALEYLSRPERADRN
jgi:C-terminal processing protease CtpA/Prc